MSWRKRSLAVCPETESVSVASLDGGGGGVVRERAVFRFELEQGESDLAGVVHGFGLVGLLALADHHGSGEAGKCRDDDDNDEKLHKSEATTRVDGWFSWFYVSILCLGQMPRFV